jgi:hypothetical protein
MIDVKFFKCFENTAGVLSVTSGHTLASSAKSIDRFKMKIFQEPKNKPVYALPEVHFSWHTLEEE